MRSEGSSVLGQLGVAELDVRLGSVGQRRDLVGGCGLGVHDEERALLEGSDRLCVDVVEPHAGRVAECDRGVDLAVLLRALNESALRIAISIRPSCEQHSEPRAVLLLLDDVGDRDAERLGLRR